VYFEAGVGILPRKYRAGADQSIGPLNEVPADKFLRLDDHAESYLTNG
jgi:hypothetical protein